MSTLTLLAVFSAVFTAAWLGINLIAFRVLRHNSRRSKQ